MGKWMQRIGAGLDAWRWRIITVAAMAFVLWVFTPPVGRYRYSGDGTWRNARLFDTRTGTLYYYYSRDCKYWSRATTLPPWSPPWWVPVFDNEAAGAPRRRRP